MTLKIPRKRGRGRTAHRLLLAALVLAGGALAGCDGDRIRALEEGVSTEADVRAQFGEPERVWPGPEGTRVFEYARQPAGQRNYMIAIGPDGRMSALRQVLTPENFAQIVPGMAADEVRRRLGKPAKTTPFPLQQVTAWDWRYLEPPATAKVFSVFIGDDGRVRRTLSTLDPQSEAQRSGG